MQIVSLHNSTSLGTQQFAYPATFDVQYACAVCAAFAAVYATVFVVNLTAMFRGNTYMCDASLMMQNEQVSMDHCSTTGVCIVVYSCFSLPFAALTELTVFTTDEDEDAYYDDNQSNPNADDHQNSHCNNNDIITRSVESFRVGHCYNHLLLHNN